MTMLLEELFAEVLRLSFYQRSVAPKSAQYVSLG